jgi:hypothetical protein
MSQCRERNEQRSRKIEVERNNQACNSWNIGAALPACPADRFQGRTEPERQCFATTFWTIRHLHPEVWEGPFRLLCLTFNCDQVTSSGFDLVYPSSGVNTKASRQSTKAECRPNSSVSFHFKRQGPTSDIDCSMCTKALTERVKSIDGCRLFADGMPPKEFHQTQSPKCRNALGLTRLSPPPIRPHSGCRSATG